MKKLEYQKIPLDKIDISFFNVRRANIKEGIEELAKSIDEIGLQQPIVVFRKRGRFELIIGQRRYLACKNLGWKKIPALITTVKNETDAIIKSFGENIHHLDLDQRDKTQVATYLLGKLQNIDKVAKCLGVVPKTVKRWLGYSAVPKPIRKMVDEGKLSATTATEIFKNISDEEKAIKIAEKIKEVPRSDDRKKIINLAKENPRKTPDEIVISLKKQKFTKVTINLTPQVSKALSKACEKYQIDAEEITYIALEEWLEKRRFIQW